ncbi:MAG: hypothetical protein BGO43_12705 [Gammaproteobacteria bacterium 39-13]|nr:hypothetical protein [Gammaproteobacteria bacterium]OJV90004.1 MAG: hypothetical protein BGO43_12705 [Gammaproteobacteria bacterium 39-13]
MPQYFVVGRPAQVRNGTNEPHIRMSSYIEEDKKIGKVVLFANAKEAEEVAFKKGGARPIITVECKDELKTSRMKWGEQSYIIAQAKKEAINPKRYYFAKTAQKASTNDAEPAQQQMMIPKKTWLRSTGEWVQRAAPPVFGIAASTVGFWYLDGVTPLVNAISQVTQMNIPNGLVTQAIGALGEGMLAVAAVTSGAWGAKRIKMASQLEKENSSLRVALQSANEHLKKTESDKERALKVREEALAKQQANYKKQITKFEQEKKKLNTEQESLKEQIMAFKEEKAQFTDDKREVNKKNQQTTRHLNAKAKKLENEALRLQDLERALGDKQDDLHRFEVELNDFERSLNAERDKLEQQRNLIKTELFSESDALASEEVEEQPGASHDVSLEGGAPIVYGFTEQQKSNPVPTVSAEEVATPTVVVTEPQKKVALH